MQETASKLETERKRLVRLELQAHGVCQPDTFGLFRNLVDAFHRVMTERPHENRLPGTGAILFSHPFDEYTDGRLKNAQLIRVASAADVEHCWVLADGVQSFVAKDSLGTGLLLLDSPVYDELDLFSLRDDALFDDDVGPRAPPTKECLIVRRSEGNSHRRITALCRERIVNFSGLSYSTKPYQYDTLLALRQQVKPFPWETNRARTMKSVLRIAVHLLSPEHIGATLVVLTERDEARLRSLVKLRKLDINGAIVPRTPSIINRSHQRPLVHLMSQKDGATILTPDGQVRYVGAFFRPGTKGKGSAGTPKEHGARHRSAEEFSKQIDGVIVVVSSDGPVTIFRGGRQLESRLDTDSLN